MIINSVNIKKFRAFNNVSFDLGSQITVIAGQNGTQKTTLLGILSQPFSITDKENPIYNEKPLCGGNFRSSFSEKFKLSTTFDKPKDHEWTLVLNRVENPDFTLESMPRGDKDQTIRFWKKNDRAKGSGYVQHPVIYLSMSRFFPIGEDNGLESTTDINLTEEEYSLYRQLHDHILIITDSNFTRVDYLSSKQKNTLGANTKSYDWKMNSAGQDNLGKIILAIISFKRLKDQYGSQYPGGILVIDEFDATLYPASQIKLFDKLRKFASN